MTDTEKLILKALGLLLIGQHLRDPLDGAARIAFDQIEATLDSARADEVDALR